MTGHIPNAQRYAVCLCAPGKVEEVVRPPGRVVSFSKYWRGRSSSSRRSLDGAGIYAIYYVGDFPSYAPVAERNHDGRFEAPIYVGKAIPLPVPVEEAAWASLPDPCCSED